MQSEREVTLYVLLAAGACAGASPFFRSGRVRAALPPGFRVACVAAVCLFLSSILTVSPGRTIVRDLNLLSAVIVFCAVFYAPEDRRPALWIAGALTLAAVALCIIGGNEYAVHFRQGDTKWRIFSTMFNPGYLAGFLVLTIPATLGLTGWARERGAVLGLGFAVVLQVAALALTGARAGVLALAVGLAVFAACAAVSRTFSAAVWIRLFATIAIAVFIAALIGRPVSSRVEQSGHAAGSESHSFAFRKLTWMGTVRTANARPATGFGPGTFDVAFPGYAVAGFTRMAHSSFLQAAAEYGWPGAVATTGAWLVVVFAGALALVRRRVEPALAPFACAAISACAATLVRGIFDSDWWSLPILLAVSALSAILARSAQSSHRTLALNTGIFGRLAAGLAALGTIAVALMVIYSSFYAESAQSREAAGNWGAALTDWKTAGRVAPWNVSARLRAAQLEDQPEVIERLHSLEPTNPRVFRALAELYLRYDQYPQALKAYQQARRLDPLSSRLTLEEALLLEKLGRPGDAEKLWDRLLVLERSPYGSVRAIPEMVDPAYAWAHARQGDDLKRSGHTHAAEEQWKQADSLLSRYFASLKKLRPVLEAAGLTDPDLERSAHALQAEVRRKLTRARTAGSRLPHPVHQSALQLQHFPQCKKLPSAANMNLPLLVAVRS